MDHAINYIYKNIFKEDISHWVLKKLFLQNPIFLNFLIHQRHNLNIIYNVECNPNTSLNNTIYFYKHGNPYHQQNDKHYTQTNLNYLTYKTAKEKMEKWEKYTIKVGKGLEIGFHNSNVLINYRIMIEESRTYENKLDQILSYLPSFQELNNEEKLQIVNQEAIKEFEKEHKEQLKQNAFLEISKQLNENYIASIQDNIENELQKIEELNNSITIALNRIESLKDKAILMDPEKSNRLQELLNFLNRSPIIYDYHTEIKTRLSSIPKIELIIKTELLYVKFFDKEKAARMLPNLVFKDEETRQLYKDALLENKYKIGIGKALIKIDIDNKLIQLTIGNEFQKIQNRHIQAQCFGQFSNAIHDAKRKFDLFALVNLVLQYVQTINIGDSAGNSTLTDYSYITDNEGNILQNPNYTHEEELK